MNRAKTLKQLLGLFETLKTPNEEPMSEFRTMAYLKALESYSDAQIEKAMWKAASACKFFPKPSELLEFIEGNKTDHAWEAWEILLDAIARVGPWKSVQFADARITRVVEVLGGWLKVCEWTEDDLKWRRNEFMSAYKAMQDGGPVRSLPGLVQIQNTSGGYQDRIPPPVVVDGALNAKTLRITEEAWTD